MATPPFSIQTTLPSSTDLASQFPTVEHTFRDVVNSWLNAISNASDGTLKASALPDDFAVAGDLSVAGAASFTNTPTVGSDKVDHIPTGYSMIFRNSTAPTGWTKRTDQNDKAFRVVSGTPTDGGTVAFSTAFASGLTISGNTGSTAAGGTVGFTTATGTVGATYLTESQIPSHYHVVQGYTGDAGTHGHSATYGGSAGTINGTFVRGNSSSGTSTDMVQAVGNHAHYISLASAYTGGSGSHTHSFTGSAHNHSFTGSSHTHTFSGTSSSINVAYIDVIVATKD